MNLFPLQLILYNLLTRLATWNSVKLFHVLCDASGSLKSQHVYNAILFVIQCFILMCKCHTNQHTMSCSWSRSGDRGYPTFTGSRHWMHTIFKPLHLISSNYYSCSIPAICKPLNMGPCWLHSTFSEFDILATTYLPLRLKLENESV